MNKKKLLILSIAFLIIIVFTYVFQNKKVNTTNNENLQTTTSNKIANFNEILPGETRIDRINELLGEPVESTQEGKLLIQEYKTSNQYRNNKIIINNETIELIIEEIINDSIKSNDIRKVYGIAPHTLYQKIPSSVFNLYVYPNNGIAYLGHEDETVLEVWYFKPTDIDDFINTWAYKYQREKFTETSAY